MKALKNISLFLCTIVSLYYCSAAIAGNDLVTIHFVNNAPGSVTHIKVDPNYTSEDVQAESIPADFNYNSKFSTHVTFLGITSPQYVGYQVCAKNYERCDTVRFGYTPNAGIYRVSPSTVWLLYWYYHFDKRSKTEATATMDEKQP